MADNRTTTLYVIAYDIPSNRRRSRVHKILSAFGRWTQYSLFECFLNERDYLRLQAMLAEHLEDAKDSVRIYPLCGTCQERVETVGGPPPEEPDLYVV
ncbi:CRISPR-associated endonuclease Cas2 [Litorilinea aerophila]|uniref:CRISPR-associated endoribonuclease Cas2 n=1 Tax=Litorilinea aerophila TaxID=1204385 RepID=A0A540VB55_9CHLR|nr:CRISPR-associated endonuclease Cas2 [Litorilinea aerophila]MCC9078147.1 CRISPR-associated endonuclease Cas2 [Litorilinea aerophila]OUC06276.1 CRISPR-associated protein Cas2 [Litorilinea aerophila]